MIQLYFYITESNGSGIFFVGIKDTRMILVGTTINSNSNGGIS